MERWNDLLRNRLAAISQSFLHARMLKHQGMGALADAVYKSSIDAMRQCDALVEHILAMGGQPDLQQIDALQIGDMPPDIIRYELVCAEVASRRTASLMLACVREADGAGITLMEKFRQSLKEQRHQLGALLENVTEVDA